MTKTEEKARKIVIKMQFQTRPINFEQAKNCALSCVDEVISQWDYIDTYLADANGELNPNLKYWMEVKQEIEKL
jgi:hypothetical protein